MDNLFATAVAWIFGTDSMGNRPSDVASPSSAAPNSYDVFLCHRGPDTKTKLVDFLQTYLKRMGVRCFVDYQMEEGVDFPATLRQAIRNSKVHIIVLSWGFAQSSWCLNEVAEIMEMRQPSKARILVLPIFFDVEPAHFRSRRPGSAYDLSRLRKRCTKTEIDRWFQALVDLVAIQGFEWHSNSSQLGKMCEDIASRVVKFLWDCAPPYAESTWASEYPIQIKQAEEMLCLHNDDNEVVSIGVLGIDKSRFAMVLYDKFRQDFPASCILLDVKGRAKSKQDLVKLQMTLLESLVNVGNVSRRIHNIVQGRALLLDRLKHVKCFIVLDDIEDDDEQLRSLLVLDQHQLCRGSRLVLTSHYPRVLADSRAHVKETIDLRDTGIEGEVDERGKRLAICWESKDVHEEFIDHLNESLSMVGLDVSEVRGVDLLKWASQKQADVVLVILSQCFVDDSTLMHGLNEAFRLLRPEVKFVRIDYGLQSGRMGSLQTEVPPQFSMDLENTSRWDFKSLINNIVFNHLQHTYKMYVTKFPEGLSARQAELKSQICDSIFSRDKVGTYGIFGMGGIGKTTLSKSLYNRFHKKFEGAVFLHMVGTETKKGRLVSLQENIATILNKDPVSIQNVDEGKALLTRRLHGTRILVILDDVNDVSQLDALFSPLDLGPGSVVVITTRDRAILESANVNNLYEMDFLDPKNSKRLFYWHAFLKPFPPKDLEGIAQEVIDACGGLPLSLEVIGAHVYNHHDPKFWKETLVHLRKADKIFEKLRVSVDALDKDQTEAFLDVCCFLIGKPLQTALRIWEGCGWAARTCVHVLKSKCLITVDPTDDTIGMHDQIRDMGRDIADRRTPRTHIWDAEHASDIPQGAIDKLRGFSAIYNTQVLHCEPSDLAGLRCSKILLLQNLETGGDWLNLRYDQIRWLQWHDSPFEKLPPGLYCSRQLRVLDLSGSRQLRTLWGRSESREWEVPKNLQELNLAGCSNLEELPQFVYLQNLEWLNLGRCKRLSYLHDSIGSLTKLKFLNLRNCSSLQSLPDTIEGLHSLEILHLSDCASLDNLPEGIGSCHNLEKLDLSWCQNLVALPDSLGALNKLREISLSETGVTHLPESFSELRNLEKLHLSRCGNLVTIPDSLGALNKLREISLDGTGVTHLPESLGELRNLEELDLSWCQNLVALPDSLGALNKLREISLYESGVTHLPESLGELRNLEKLHLSSCKNLVALPDSLGASNKLREISLVGTRVTHLPESLGKLRNLEELDLSWCQNLVALPDSLGALNKLREISLSGTGVTHLPESFGKLRNLEKLHLSWCKNLIDLPDSLGALNMLRNCNLSGCKKLWWIPEILLWDNVKSLLCELTSLVELDVSDCDLKNLPERIGNLQNLRTFRLTDNGQLRRLPASMGDLRSLTVLDLRRCSLEDEGLLGELLKKLESLKEMNIDGAKMRSLDVISDNGQATFLTILSMEDCCNLERVSGLDGLKRLERLVLRGCDKLRYLKGLEGLTSLQELDISLCRALDSRRFAADTLGLQAVRELYIEESSVVPSMHLLQRPNLELLSWCGSELRGGFSDWRSVSEWEYYSIDLCNDSGEDSTSRPSNFAAVLVSLLIPTKYLGRLSLRRDVIVVDLYELSNSQAKDQQIILLILRPGCELLQRCPQENGKINIPISARKPLQVSHKVVWGGLVEFCATAGFRDISAHTSLDFSQD